MLSVTHVVLCVSMSMLQTCNKLNIILISKSTLSPPHRIWQHPLISHLILIYHKKIGHYMEIVQFYYFWPFSAWTSAIVPLLLHWPHPASAHLLQQGDVYLLQEEIKALLHELQICKSYTVQIDCRARTADCVRWGPPIESHRFEIQIKTCGTHTHVVS